MIISEKESEINLLNKKKEFVRMVIPICLLMLNFFLKVIFISSNSIAGDEPFSIYHAQMPVLSIIKQLTLGNNPPLYELLLHFWIKLFGISELSVRFPSLIFSTSSVYYLYRIGKDFFNFRIALTASLLFTFSNYHLGFAHEARVYPLFTLLTAMSMFYYLKYYVGQSNSKYYYFLLFTNIILIYAHYFGLFVIFIQTVSAFYLEKDKKSLLKKYWIYLFLLTIAYIPNLNILFSRFISSVTYGTWVKPPTGIESIYNMLWQFSNKPITTVISIIILITAAIQLIVKRKTLKIYVQNKIVLTWFLLPFLLMFAVSYRIPMFLDRYLVFVSVSYYLVTAICCDYIFKGNRYAFIMPIFIVLLYSITFKPNLDNGRHVKETVLKIAELKEADTKVIICPQHFILNFSYYFDKFTFQDVDNQNVYPKMLENLQRQNIFGIKNIQDIDLKNTYKVIYLDAAADFSYPDNNVLQTLRKNYLLKGIYKYPEIFTVYEFISKK